MNRWWTLAGLWLLYLAFGLTAGSIAPLVLLIERDLSISHAAMGSIMGAWQLTYIFAALPGGVLLDRLGSRRALAMGGLLIGLSALGRAFADSYWTLFLAVSVFGVGGPIVSSGAPKVVSQLFTGSDRGLAMGIYMTGPAMGGVISLTLTHSVLLPFFNGNWQAVMCLWAGFSAAASLIWFMLAGRSGLVEHEVASFKPSMPRREAMIEIASTPAVQIILLMGLGIFAFNHGLNNWLPELLRTHGLPLVEASYWAALPTVIGIAGSLLIPRLATTERRFKILLGLCLAALMASILLHFVSGPWLTIGLIMQGIARSALMTVVVLALLEQPKVGESRAGMASGMFFTVAEVGGVLGPVALGAMYDATGNFRGALLALSAIAVMLTIGTLVLARLTFGAKRLTAS
jgi:MFS transporter, CP family, cyanate transporter